MTAITLPSLSSVLRACWPASPRRQRTAQAAPFDPRAAQGGFTAEDWHELSQRWRDSAAFQPARVIDWRARREVASHLNGYPADEAVCSARRHPAGAVAPGAC